MQPCKCNKKQSGDECPGGHLKRDCDTFPKEETAKPGDKTETAKKSLVVELIDGMGDAEVESKLNALFGIDLNSDRE